ncbi:hypothetical protein Tco_1302560 [Tanacetum coccineum]
MAFESCHVVPPPPTGIFSPLRPDLSYSGLEEFQQPEFEGYGPKTSKNVSENTLLVEELVSDDKLEKKIVSPTVSKIKFIRPKQQEKSVRKDNGAPIIEDWESDSDEEDESKPKFVRPKPARKPVKQVRQDTNSPSNKARGNQRNWNNMVSQRLGSDYEMINKSCYSPLILVPTQDPSMNRVKNNVKIINKAHSSDRRPFNKLTAKKNSNYYHRVNTIKRSGIYTARLRPTVNTARPTATVNTARPRVAVNTARTKAVLNAVKGNLVNAVKASACWIQVSDGLGPKEKLIFLSSVQGNPIDLQEQIVIDSGCSKHMTENMSYFADNEQIDKGYVAFGGNPKGGKIKGEI